MRFTFFKNTLFLGLLLCFSCVSQTKEPQEEKAITPSKTSKEALPIVGRSISGLSSTHILTGANQWSAYIDLMKDKKVGVVSNQTSLVNDTLEYPNEVRVVDMHLVDFLNEMNVNVVRALAPEHGFRGTADAGEFVKDGVDQKTQIPIVSLYGKNKKPSPTQLEGLDLMVFDIQDVGARFYTYISTLHYVMEACAEAGIPVIVLDRPNPNGRYIDGPILELEHTGFVGMHPIPVVHGMTIGEYAQMINGEGWLKNGIKCELEVITMKNYTRNMSYSLVVKPSPNLPNDQSINLYPSLCFFEGTVLSAGRGTDQQFQIFGAPNLPTNIYTYQFTPQENVGAKYPKFKGEVCNGTDLSEAPQLNKIHLEWLLQAYANYENKSEFFIPYFTTLAGTKTLQQQIESGMSAEEIRASWQEGLNGFDTMRTPYLLYN